MFFIYNKEPKKIPTFNINGIEIDVEKLSACTYMIDMNYKRNDTLGILCSVTNDSDVDGILASRVDTMKLYGSKPIEIWTYVM